MKRDFTKSTSIEKPGSTLTSGTEKPLAVGISPIKVTVALLCISVLLLLGNLVSVYLIASGKNSQSVLLWYTAWYFDFNGESNFPAFFSTLALMFAALLNLVIYRFLKTNAAADSTYWLVLGLIFAFLSIDENVQLHEAIAKHLRPVLPTDFNGFFYWAWVVPYSVVALAVAAYFFTFVLNLPKKTRTLFIASGLLFMLGALGLEFIEGYYFKLYGLDHLINKILYCIEELFEMWGIIIFIYALLDYARSLNIRLRFNPQENA
ncbi:multidrug transporter [Cesiribacter sp. SM1]|uniref:multidrug transporter n=1 Tax=Cesiribacter sp. SM1 TaxID=2861196 RepID=UPI001CD45F0C|nr:multidrug transporter [Cesiribacter sp. SM1]